MMNDEPMPERLPNRLPDDVARRLVDEAFADRFESPIEERLYHYVAKFLRPEVVLTREVKVPTPLGAYRVDFVIQTGGRRIGIECDGKEFHPDPRRDHVRDAMIMAASEIDVIYRVTGSDIAARLPQVAYQLSRQEAIAFRADAIDVLSRIGHRSEHRYERDDERRDGPNDYASDPYVSLIRKDRRSRDYAPGPLWWREIESAVRDWQIAGGRGGAAEFVADVWGA